MTTTSPALSPDDHPDDPKNRILDAAERLFYERGVGATSLRAITQAAGMNVAAIHYHFGSKESLLLAVARRRAEPINRARLEAFDELEAGAAGQPVPVRDLVEAFLRPELMNETMSAILLQEPSDVIAEIVPKLFGEVHGRMLGLLVTSLPHLDRLECERRLRFAVGSMLHVLRGLSEIEMPGGAPREAFDPDRRLAELVTFLTAGFLAPPSSSPPS